jgi:hypothetical protein
MSPPPREKRNSFGATLELKSIKMDWKKLEPTAIPKNLDRFFQSSVSTGKFLDGSAGQDLLIFRRGGSLGAGYGEEADAIVVPGDDLFPDIEPTPAAGLMAPPSGPIWGTAVVPASRARERRVEVLEKLPISEPAEPVARLALDGEKDALIGLASQGCQGRFDCAMEQIRHLLGTAPKALCGATGVCFYVYGLDGSQPARLPIHASPEPITAIDPSFVARPILFASNGSGSQTELFLTRVAGLGNTCEKSPGQQAYCVESGLIEVVVLAFARDSAGLSLNFSRGASCRFSQTFGYNPNQQNPNACVLPTTEMTRKRLTWSNRMRGSQTLVGDFLGTPDLDIAFIDTCYPAEPIVLQGVAAPHGRPATLRGKSANTRIALDCMPIEGSVLATEPAPREAAVR